ncbi:TPA: ribose-5-phosphate isomerase RpiA [Candidatus Micrarchaeota archaeon]|nr:ribose-5-phosphate isomerase RpiA [Candidatus Micrarchaeota archaeon]
MSVFETRSHGLGEAKPGRITITSTRTEDMDPAKYASAHEALRFVKKGMSVGLGTGSTAEIFIDLLGKKNASEYLELCCIATSKASEAQALRLGMRLCGFDEIKKLDAAFDGADQVDWDLNLIKGLGGALVREKIVDYRAEKFYVMAGESKLVERLSGAIPVEVIPMAEEAVKRDLMELGATKFETRKDGRRKFISDNSNLIVHAHFQSVEKPEKLEDEINGIAGVVDNGIFAHKKPVVIVGRADGGTRILR